MKALVAFSVFMLLAPAVCSACEQHGQFDPTAVAIADLTFSYASNGNREPLVTAIGTIKNSSKFKLEELVIEVKYFDADKRLIDVVTESPYELVVPASQEVAFRIRAAADKPKNAYASSEARVVSAERISNQPMQKKPDSIWWNMFVSWFPMLLLIGIWIFFIRRMNSKTSTQGRTLAAIEAQNVYLERLAVAAEKTTSEKNH